MIQTTLKKHYRPDEVARFLALSPRTIYRMIGDGRLSAVRWGNGPWRIPHSSLTKLFDHPQTFGDHPA